jgi:trans-aconitate 2-methyltransferase
MRQIVAERRWRPRLDGVLRHDDVATPGHYLELLANAGLRSDVWQTEYLHALTGSDPVLEWVRGTGLRPVLQALGEAAAAEFVTDYGARLRQAYPQRSFGTVFGFRRTFVVARKPG